MNYDTIVETITQIINDDLIYKKGLVLEYRLDEKTHIKLNEHFYYKSNPDKDSTYEYTDEFEIEVDGVLIRFVIDD
tara:strand:- start:7355 stop:7582 length:228 start_codon:yes stop_codon:yes gene_type:complete